MADPTTTDGCQSITDFINAFKGGTRLNRFVVQGNILPGNGGTTNQISSFHVRAATLPEAAVGPITINHRGRSVSYPGDRTYQPWSITILDDHDGTSTGGTINLYKMFHDWHDRINSHTKNVASYPTGQDPSSLFAKSWYVKQLNSNGGSTPLGGRTFTLYNVWPVAVGPLTFDMSQDNVLNSFSVTLAYSHYKYDGAPVSDV